MLIDSHCHLNHIDLSSFDGSLEKVLDEARVAGVGRFLCVSISPSDFPELVALAQKYPMIDISVGIHPNELTLALADAVEQMTPYASHVACIAIGETGLDYYRTEPHAISLQKQQFIAHIELAKTVKKPLIIHTREAAADTIELLTQYHADEVGGVFHCFTETWDVAKQALALGFYISFSGILTFKNAKALQDLAKKVPLDRVLIETDSPYLAPVPFRGQQNHPACVKYVALALSELTHMSVERIAEITTKNYFDCFKLDQRGFYESGHIG